MIDISLHQIDLVSAQTPFTTTIVVIRGKIAILVELVATNSETMTNLLAKSESSKDTRKIILKVSFKLMETMTILLHLNHLSNPMVDIVINISSLDSVCIIQRWL